MTTRIAVDGRELVGGVRTGIGRFIVEVLRVGAASEGLSLVLYTTQASAGAPMMSGIEVREVPGRWTPWWDQVGLPRQLARDRVDIFLSPYYKAPLLAPCPVVLTIHDLFFIGYLGRRRVFYDAALTRLARLYALRAAAIIADSAYSKRAIVERLGIDPRKVTTIPVGLGPEFRPAAPVAPVRCRYGLTAPYILYVGNFKPHKNLPRVLGAFARLPEPLRDGYQLVLAGADRANRPALEELARVLGLARRLRFPGAIADADLPAVYGGAALVVLLSLEEGFGLPALEAMACGVPVLASDRAALPEVVGDAALLVDPEDEAAIAFALRRALEADDLRDRLTREGLARARQFSPDRTAGRVVALLRQVSGAR